MNIQDNSPELPAQNDVSNDTQQTQRWLLVLISTTMLLLVVGIVIGVFAFRTVLRPGQQQRVIQILPFMERLLPSNPGAGLALPTPLATYATGVSPSQLLTPMHTTETPDAAVILASPTPTVLQYVQSTEPSPTFASTPTQVPTPTLPPPTITVEPTSLTPSTAYLTGFRYVTQTWNNCGPATITMALSYFGWQEGMEFAASILKPDDEDKNVTSIEMTAFVNDQSGVRALWRMGGTEDLLKSFLANGFPVVIAIGFAPEGYDWLGHYRLLVGYDDSQGVFFAYDSYLGNGDNGNGITVPYGELDADWRQFNRKFIVLYRPGEEIRLRDLLGEWVEPARAAELALERAQEETRVTPQDGFAWFNAGTSLVALGRYDEAALAYDQSRRFSLPWRMLWYQFGPFEAYFNVGRYSDLEALVTANLNNGGQYIEETYYWQGQLYITQGLISAATDAFERSLQINPNFVAARNALSSLTGS
ncbi:MAG TPA: C39 family peptidase [Aggregatilineales bacterium]|nr:C39 family peptidase [Aggregatilineales bacterium]